MIIKTKNRKWRMIIITTSKKNQAIKIKSIQANSLYIVNAYNKNKNVAANAEMKKLYLDIGEAVINNSLFSD